MEPAEGDAKTELTLEDLMQYMEQRFGGIEQRFDDIEQRFRQQQAFNEHVQRSLEEINQRRSGRSSRARSEIIQVDQLSEIPVQQSLSVGVVNSNLIELESVVSVQDVDISDAIVVVEVDAEIEESSTDIASEDLELTDNECYAVQKVVSDLVDSVGQYDVQSNNSLETFDSVVDFQVVIQDDVIDAENDVPIFFGKETTADDATVVFERMSVVPFSVSNAVLNSLMLLRYHSVTGKLMRDCLIFLSKQYAACVVCQFLVKDKKLQLLMQKLVLIEEHGPGPPLYFL